MIKPILELAGNETPKSFLYGILFGVLYLFFPSTIIFAIFPLLARITIFVLEKIYNTSALGSISSLMTLVVIVVVYILMLLIGFIWIMYKLIKQKQWGFTKGFLIGSLLPPLILGGFIWITILLQK